MQLFNRFSVGAKIIAGYVIALTLMVVVGVVAIVRLNEVGGTVADVTDNLAVDRQLGNDMVAEILLVRFYANKYTATQNQNFLDRYTEELNKLEQILAEAETEITNVERAALLDEIQADTATYRSAFEEVSAIVQTRYQVQSDVLEVQGPLAESELIELGAHAFEAGDASLMQRVGEAQTALIRMRMEVSKFLIDGDAKYATRYEQRNEETQAALAELDALVTDPDLRQHLVAAMAAVETYAESFKGLQADYSQYLDLQINTLDVLGPKIRETASAIVASVGEDFEARGLATEVALSETQWVLVAVMGVALTVGLGLGFLISRGITRPLQQVTRMSQQVADVDLSTLVSELEAMAQGDLTRNFVVQAQELPVTSQDEVGRMASAFNTIVARLQAAGQAFSEMTARLGAAINQVADNAASVGSASSQLAAAAGQAGQATSQIASTVQQVARGTTQQTEGITKTAASMEQMKRAIDGVAQGAQEQGKAVGRAAAVTAQLSTVIEQVTANADAVSRDSATAAEAARVGAQKVEDTVQGMNNIRTKVGVSAARVQEMSERSDQIGVIVETIDDIASQTNLLALNAAIEAARAGEHGKGFAVVADEVRKLAERSSTATKEIGGLIRGIQKTVTEAMRAMAEGGQEVEQGALRANEAGQALADILKAAQAVNRQAEATRQAAGQMEALSTDMVGATDTVSAVVEENTAATEEMATGSVGVLQAIENIASVSEENSAAVEEVSASAEEMSAQVEEVNASAQSLADMAAQLQQVVAGFKLAHDHEAIAATPAPASTVKVRAQRTMTVGAR